MSFRGIFGYFGEKQLWYSFSQELKALLLENGVSALSCSENKGRERQMCSDCKSREGLHFFLRMGLLLDFWVGNTLTSIQVF